MTHTARAREAERLATAEAFDIIGNETRLKILQALFEEKYGDPVSFSALRKRVEVRDGSLFNFHLKKLEGPFIRKTDEGYEIRHAGLNVIRTILSGSFTDHPRIAPFETGGACVACGAVLHAEYDHEMVFVRCSSCRTMHTMGMFPPGAVVDRTDQEVLAAFDRWQRHDFGLSVNRVCSMCGGKVTATLIRDAKDMKLKVDIDPTEFPQYDLGMRYQCEQCDVWDFGSPGKHLLTHPAVVAFHHDHGIDLTTVPFWELDWVVGTGRTTVVSEDPLRIRVAIPLDDEEIRVTLDEAFAVNDVERTPTPP